jgi:hypothetical protein
VHIRSQSLQTGPYFISTKIEYGYRYQKAGFDDDFVGSNLYREKQKVKVKGRELLHPVRKKGKNDEK